MKKAELKTIEPVSAARIGAVFTAAYAAVICAIAFLIMLVLGIMSAAGGSADGLLFAGAGFVVLLVVGIMYTLAGALAGFVMALAYNFVAAKFGGLEIELS
ncbi:MAG: hypothetical protein V1822_03195 [Candidatus Micrarchaeota archaeon]